MASGFRLADPREYRRGVVLGLTLAEVLILLVFLLVLSSSALLAHRDHALHDAEFKLARYETAMAPLLEQMRSNGGNVRDADDLVARLERVRDFEQMERELRSANSALTAALSASEHSERTLNDMREKLDALTGDQKTLASKAADDDAMAALLQHAPVQGGSNSEKLRTVLERASQQAIANQNLTGQNAQMRAEIARVKGNGGSGLPYCWTTIDGHPIYMLRIELRDDGVIVHEVSPRPKPDDAAWPLLDPLPREELMPVTRLLSATTQLQATAAAAKCRYGVLATDGTAKTNKLGYKSLMHYLWSAFTVNEVAG